MTELDIDATIAGLTLEEKASLCSGSDFWHTESIDRAAISPLLLSDGPHGLRKQASAADHVGLGDSVPATCFPPAVGLGSSWNPSWCERVGEALGAEARAAGHRGASRSRHQHQALAAVRAQLRVLLRRPLWSRRARRGAGARNPDAQGVGASVKHFAANNQETDRMRVSAEVDERTLREIYLPASSAS